MVAYVLTPNHVHLLVRVGEIPLGRGTQFVQGDFAQWYDRRYGYAGHFVSGPVCRKTLRGRRYLWALVRYIHLNPVRAGLVSSPAAYRWSSFREYAIGRWEVVDGAEAARVLGRPEAAEPGV